MFRSEGDRADHFKKHGWKVNATSPEDYEDKADRFLCGARDVQTLECTREDGALLRYNPVTDHFGVIGPDGFISTYFRPMLGSSARGAEYFRQQCGGRRR
jgi:pyocin large subunit-like protein